MTCKTKHLWCSPHFHGCPEAQRFRVPTCNQPRAFSASRARSICCLHLHSRPRSKGSSREFPEITDPLRLSRTQIEPNMSTSAGNELRGKLALITGASGGIGAACARHLWLQGASLALTYSSSEDKILRLEEELWKLRPISPSTEDALPPPVISTHKADLSRPPDIDRLFASLSQLHSQPGPDILISNAGHGKRIPDIDDISLEEFDYTIHTNLRASFLLSKYSIPHMREKHWGRIIYVSSLAAHGGGINGCHYAASKAGLHGLMKNLATKHAKDGITVNDVAPAMIGETGMIPDEKAVEGTPGDVRNIPVGRLGTPHEVANVVVMFCRTGYLTGQSVLLSGGLK